mgnify:CR=1 FL=1
MSDLSWFIPEDIEELTVVQSRVFYAAPNVGQRTRNGHTHRRDIGKYLFFFLCWRRRSLSEPFGAAI